MSEYLRGFFAIDIENDGIINRLSKVQLLLYNTGADLKLIKPQNIHLTIKFMGNISLSIINAIFEEMKQIAFNPFSVDLGGLGVFPRLSHPRIVWVGVKKGADDLINIFEQLEPRLRGLGFKPDSKRYSPHLTIARVKSGRNKSQLIKRIKELENYDFGTLNVEYLRLKKSVLTPRGPVYTTLKEVKGS